jgi:Tol biopolymer transport system component
MEMIGRRRNLLRSLAVVVIGLFGFVRCLIFPTEDEITIPDRITDPLQLSENLSNQRILFYTSQEVYITTLIRETIDTIKLPEPGSRIRISPYSACCLAYSTFNSIWIIDFQLEKNLLVVDTQIESPNLIVGDPAFSPDSQKLVFSMIWDTTDEYDLATVNSNGENFQRLDVRGYNNEPKYSPDGKWILTVCEGDVEIGGFQLCIMNSDGKGRKWLTNNPGEFHHGWFTPDGTRIVFSRLDIGMIKDRVGLYVMDIDESNIIQLIEWHARVLTFSADGNEVVFCKFHDDGGCEGIYVINLDGTNLRHLAYFDDVFLSKWY